MTLTEEKKMPPKTPPLMFACIERAHGITFCNRCPDREFIFTSYRHAVALYNPRDTTRTPFPRLKTCIACYDAAVEHIAKEDQSRLA